MSLDLSSLRVYEGKHDDESKSSGSFSDDRYLLEEEDLRTLEVAVEELGDPKQGPASPLLRGMDLDLTFAASRKSEEGVGLRGVQEESVLVIFDLPDGSQGESLVRLYRSICETITSQSIIFTLSYPPPTSPQFKLGQTVEVLKSFIESEYGIPMQEQVLFLDERPMMNPLSLLDFPEAKGVEELFVRVDGPLPEGGRK